MRKTIMKCDKCGKDIGLSYTPNFDCTNNQGVIETPVYLDKLHDLLYESEYDLCEECAGSLAHYILKWKTAKKGVKKSLRISRRLSRSQRQRSREVGNKLIAWRNTVRYSHLEELDGLGNRWLMSLVMRKQLNSYRIVMSITSTLIQN